MNIVTEIFHVLGLPLGWDVELDPESLLDESESLPLPDELPLLDEFVDEAVELESVVVD